MDKTRDQNIGEFNYEAVIAYIDNSCAEYLRITFVNLTFVNLEFLHPKSLNFRIGCSALGRSNVLGNRRDLTHVDPRLVFSIAPR